MTEEQVKSILGVHGGQPFGLGFVFAPRPATLYHYTDLSGFMGIVRSGQIWATDTRFLNDVTEAQQIWSFLIGRLKAFRSKGVRFDGIELDD